jgi:hypothetical protein
LTSVTIAASGEKVFVQCDVTNVAPLESLSGTASEFPLERYISERSAVLVCAAIRAPIATMHPICATPVYGRIRSVPVASANVAVTCANEAEANAIAIRIAVAIGVAVAVAIAVAPVSGSVVAVSWEHPSRR